jgi:GNAT superfamily N-acetyltransferase
VDDSRRQTEDSLMELSHAQTSGHNAGWVIRQGDATDLPAIARLCEVTYGVPRPLDSLRWLYEENPAGRCQLWIAEDPDSGQVVGTRPMFPWRLWVNGRELRVAQLGDAMTHPQFRGRGIFSELVRSAWSALIDQGVPFTFSFSNPGSLSVYKKTRVSVGHRVGTREVLQFRRMARPLSLKAIFGHVPWARGVVGSVDRLTRAYLRRRLALPRRFSVFPIHHFGGEFDELWERARGAFRVLTVRDTTYLNWRFIAAPQGAFRVLGVRQDGELAGYVAFEMDSQGDGWIADLFGLAQPEVIGALLKGALARMLEDGAAKSYVWAAPANASYPLLQKLGFIARDDVVPMAVHVYRDGDEADAALEAAHWWAWYGDRDVEREATAGSPVP